MRCKGTLAAVLVLTLVLFSSAPVTCLAFCGASPMGMCPVVAAHQGGGSAGHKHHASHAVDMVMVGHTCAPGHRGSDSSEHAQASAHQAAQQTLAATMNAGCDRSMLCPTYLQSDTSLQAEPSFAQATPFASPALVVLARIWSPRSRLDVRGHRPRFPVQSLTALRRVLLRV